MQFTLREFASHLGRELLSEQVAIVRTNAGKITSVVGYYDSNEFREQFWSAGATGPRIGCRMPLSNGCSLSSADQRHD